MCLGNTCPYCFQEESTTTVTLCSSGGFRWLRSLQLWFWLLRHKGVGFMGVRVRTRESNSTFAWYCVTAFWPFRQGDGSSKQPCMRIICWNTHICWVVYNKACAPPPCVFFWPGLWCHLMMAHATRLSLLVSSKPLPVLWGLTGASPSVLITKVCRMFLHAVTLQLPQNSYLFLKINVLFHQKSNFSISVCSDRSKYPLVASTGHWKKEKVMLLSTWRGH